MDDVLFFKYHVLPKCFILGILSIAVSFLMHLQESETLYQVFLGLALCILVSSIFWFRIVKRRATDAVQNEG